jgi:Ras-related protein Rab-1A
MIIEKSAKIMGSKTSLWIELIGDSGVGKSCILLKYINDTYTDSYISTIGSDYMSKELDNNLTLKIWDLMGDPRYFEILRRLNSHICIVVYDVTDQASFTNIKQWMKSIELYRENPYICIVGSKVDLDSKRVTSYEEGKKLAKSYNCDYFEVSSKTGENIDSTFSSIIENYYKSKLPPLPPSVPKKKFWSYFNISNWF